jgi:hypothetical protein
MMDNKRDNKTDIKTDTQTITVPGKPRTPWFPAVSFFDKQVPFFDADPLGHSAAGTKTAANTRGEPGIGFLRTWQPPWGLYTHIIQKGA